MPGHVSRSRKIPIIRRPRRPNPSLKICDDECGDAGRPLTQGRQSRHLTRARTFRCAISLIRDSGRPPHWLSPVNSATASCVSVSAQRQSPVRRSPAAAHHLPAAAPPLWFSRAMPRPSASATAPSSAATRSPLSTNHYTATHGTPMHQVHRLVTGGPSPFGAILPTHATTRTVCHPPILASSYSLFSL